MSNLNKIISVIIPVYNVENYIEKCLNSIVNQTYNNLEIIIIDDGSTDNSIAIAEKIAENDKRIRIISQVNQGVSSARNLGLDNASGEYILFIDSDDWLDLETCKIALDTMIKHDADVVMWPYISEYPLNSKVNLFFENKDIVWDETNIEELRRRMVGPINEELFMPHALDSVVTVWGKLYKRSAINNVRFVDINEIGTEDALFNIEAFNKVNKTVYISSIFYHYRKDNLKSITHSYKFARVHQWLELYTKIEQFIKINNLNSNYNLALNNRICLGLIGLGINLAEDKKIKYHIKKSELKKILSMDHYVSSLNALDFKYLSFKWKIFFILARNRSINLFYILLFIMNKLRGR